MMGDLPRWKNSGGSQWWRVTYPGLIMTGDLPVLVGVSIVTDDLPGSDYDGWPARVSGVSIVTEDFPGSDYDGWPARVSGVSIVTEDFPGSDYDGWPARVRRVSIVTEDFPGSDYDGWPARMEDGVSFFWVTYPDGIW